MAEEIIDITGFSFDGAGIGHLHSGRALFVPGAIPGDKAAVVIRREGRGRLSADLVRILAPAPGRARPECPLFGRCGGCQLQHIDYATQAALKGQIVADALRSVGGIDAAVLVHQAENPWFYRNRGQFPVAFSGGRLIVGLFGEKSHKVVPIAGECRLFHPKIIELLKAVQDMLPAGAVKYLCPSLRHVAIRINGAGDELLLTFIMRRREERAAAILTELAAPLKEKVPQLAGVTLNINPHEGGEVFGSHEELLWGKSAISHTFMAKNFMLSSRSFFQNNYFMAEKMFSSLKSLLPKVPLLIDAYAGVGVIGSILADMAKEVISIEENAAAVADGRLAVKNNNLAAKQHFICGKSEVEIPKMNLPAGALLLVDPPRGGVDKALWESIAATSLAQIAYISCNPGTLARDLKILQAMGFCLEHISAYDLFPETVHIETVAILSRETSY